LVLLSTGIGIAILFEIYIGILYWQYIFQGVLVFVLPILYKVLLTTMEMAGTTEDLEVDGRNTTAAHCLHGL